jgi:hypothetical protein
VSTLGALKARIAGDLLRSDLTAQIAAAVPDAIRAAAANRFWFNEVRGLTFNTVAGQDFYGSAALADIAWLSSIDAAWITVNGQRRTLGPTNALDIDELLEGTPSNGEPYLYARQADGLRLYRTPDRAYPVFIDGVSRLSLVTASSPDNTTNAWFTEGERLVRALAKAMIFEDVIGDYAAADRQNARAEVLKRDMLLEMERRLEDADTLEPWG